MPQARLRTKAPNAETPKPLLVAGVMSGTSADGIDVALCRIAPGPEGLPKLKVLGHRSFPYPKPLRAAVLAAMDARGVDVADLSRLHWRLGEAYADAIERTVADLGRKPALVAIHGQTLYHQPTAQKFLGRPMRATWQAGEPAVVAERLGLPVISDMRTADFAAGGQGAPLVPMLDLCLFRHRRRSRVLLNLGGIANLTAIPAGGGLDDVLAFDTGPGNMVIDGCAQALLAKPIDRNGSIASRGKVTQPVLDRLLANPYFAAAPPKSCGREQFGQPFAEQLLEDMRGSKSEDVLATVTALTVETIVDAYRRFCWPHLGQRAPAAQGTDLLVAGGGARNRTIMRGLRDALEPLGIDVQTTADAGLAIEAKEAAAFALLGWLSWHRLPGNVPAATGASRPAVLGRLTLV